MASQPDHEANQLLAQALEAATGLFPDDVRNVIIVYETTQDTIGALSFACCTEHTLKMLALATVVVIEDPLAPFGQDCTG